MRSVVLAALLVAGLPAHAATIVLDFEEEAVGARGLAYASAECAGCVTFSSQNDPEDPMYVYDWGFADGHGFSTFADDSTGLTLTFASPVEYLSLDFMAGEGCSECPTGYVPEGAEAVLSVWNGDTKLGEARLLLDRGGEGMDQNIAISGLGPFDSAVCVPREPRGSFLRARRRRGDRDPLPLSGATLDASASNEARLSQRQEEASAQ